MTNAFPLITLLTNIKTGLMSCWQTDKGKSGEENKQNGKSLEMLQVQMQSKSKKIWEQEEVWGRARFQKTQLCWQDRGEDRNGKM